MSKIPQHITDDIADHLNAIAAHFKAPKLTLLVRSPDTPGDADMVMTNDDLPAAIAALQFRHEKGIDE